MAKFALVFSLYFANYTDSNFKSLTSNQQNHEIIFPTESSSFNLRLIYKHIEEKAVLQKDSQAPDAVDTLKRQLTSAKPTSDIELDSLVSQPVPEADDLYQHMVKSSLFLGKFYDCGRCDRSHLALSGGIVISESGLALTNYHVMDPKVMGTTEGFIAMAYDGQCFEVEKVLAADQVADIALVQLKANGYKFHAAPIAKSRPSPMNTVHIISNPSWPSERGLARDHRRIRRRIQRVGHLQCCRRSRWFSFSYPPAQTSKFQTIGSRKRAYQAGLRPNDCSPLCRFEFHQSLLCIRENEC